jgi:polysaccharide chain length determinant protein (PEP-CTERM system associated)
MEENVRTLSEFTDILKRRKGIIIWTAMMIFITAAFTAFLIPPTYRSTSTILIEEQEIPKEYVMTTVTSYAEQRLQSINQRIMSSSRLLEIINRFSLYADLRERWTVEAIIEKMRKDIRFETISADVVDRRTGRPTAATIAFSIAYDGKSPNVVQQVANVLASLYLEENLKVREQQTIGASRFIEEEMKSIQANLADLDARMAAFKSRNIGALPEMAQLNLQNLDRLDLEIAQLNDQHRTLKEKESSLQYQLASTPMESSNPVPDKARLKELRNRLIMFQNRYLDAHPDVKETKAEIAALERRLGTTIQGGEEERPDNPVYITMASQLSGVQTDIESVKRQIADMAGKREEMRKRVTAGPRVEEHYRVLLTERNNTQAKYDDLMRKAMEAKVAHGMEKEQMGERFTLIDAARLPERPVKPNIPAILLIGLILGIGGGVGLASLREFSDQSVRSPEALAEATSMLVLGSVTEIVTHEDKAGKRRSRISYFILVILLIACGVLAFHFLVMDLDVFWARLMRRLML